MIMFENERNENYHDIWLLNFYVIHCPFNSKFNTIKKKNINYFITFNTGKNNNRTDWWRNILGLFFQLNHLFQFSIMPII